QSLDFKFQLFSRPILGHLGFEPERDRSGDGLRLIGVRIDDRAAEVSIPLPTSRRDPSLLVRFTHLFLVFLCGGTSGPSSFYRRFRRKNEACSRSRRNSAIPLER